MEPYQAELKEVAKDNNMASTAVARAAPPGAIRSSPLTPVEVQGPPRLLVETVAVLILTMTLAVVANLVPRLANPFGIMSLLLPLVYLFLERRLRHRSWEELGIRWHGFAANVRSNWWLFLLVVVVLQLVPVGLAHAFWPDTISHISGRIPAFGTLPVLIPLILVLSLREELVFRGLFQERIGWFLGQLTAIAGVSALFAMTHIATGAAAIVAVDLLFVFFDSVVYGLIYSRSRNVFVAWTAHAGSDLIGLAILLWASSNL